MHRLALLALFLVGCGPAFTFEQDEVSAPVENVRTTGARPSPLFETIGDLVCLEAGKHGYVTAHMEHATYTVNDPLIAEYQKINNIPGELLGFAGCNNWREFCGAVFPSWVEQDDKLRLAVGVHEALHMLGFGHEVCEPGQCQGIMAASYESRFEGTELDALSAEYLNILPYKEPVQ